MGALQRAILSLLKVPRRPEPPSFSGARILAVQIAGMGDFTLAVPALRALRRANPSGRLDLLTSEKGRRAAEGCPHIDEIESLDPGPPSAGALTLLPLIRRVRRRRYDIALNLMGLYSPQGAVRMGLLLRSLAIPFLAGRDTRGAGTF
jgi:ADP-heptose:LPS heptosyltransferase